MTTIACNRREMAADTKVSCEGIGTDVFSSIKLFSAQGSLFGMAGEDCNGQMIAFEWIQNGGTVAKAGDRPPPLESPDWIILELSRGGIAIWNKLLEREPILNQYIAVGSGRKVAMRCMAAGMSPAEAVYEACKADDFSDYPIYHATLRDRTVREWHPKRKR